jgi:hypothetical protein
MASDTKKKEFSLNSQSCYIINYNKLKFEL